MLFRSNIFDVLGESIIVLLLFLQICLFPSLAQGQWRELSNLFWPTDLLSQREYLWTLRWNLLGPCTTQPPRPTFSLCRSYVSRGDFIMYLKSNNKNVPWWNIKVSFKYVTKQREENPFQVRKNKIILEREIFMSATNELSCSLLVNTSMYYPITTFLLVLWKILSFLKGWDWRVP